MQEVNLIIRECDFARLMALRPPPELRAELDRAIVVTSASIPENIVTMGSRVCYRDHQTGENREVELVYPDEADSATGKVSVLAPVGAALIGLGVGQEIQWDFPNGAVRRLTVLAVIQPPPDATEASDVSAPSH